MRRRALIAATLAATLTGAAAASAATTPTTVTTPTPPPPPTTTPTTTTPVPPVAPRVTVSACQTGVTPVTRNAVFFAEMPAMVGESRLGMRFDLYLRRIGRSDWRRLVVPKWGTWQLSRTGVPAFAYGRRVDGLSVPGTYRTTVRFRWYGPKGQVLRSAERTSPGCVQPDPRPDLGLGPVTARLRSEGIARYTLVIRNDGMSPAGPFGIVLDVAGAEQPVSVVRGLAAGTQATVTIDAPACTGGVLRIALDPDNAVDEAREPSGPVVRSCPL